MGTYAYLICPETKLQIWLGKAVFMEEESDGVSHFHIGPREGPRNWEKEILNRVLWKFLADHAGKELRVLLEGQFDDSDFTEIGDDSTLGISFQKYLENWRGDAKD